MNDALPAPVLLSFIICDQVIVDVVTKKHSIIGAFEDISAFEFPAQHPWLAVFAQWTNGHGEMLWRVELLDVEADDRVLGQVGDKIAFEDVRQVVSIGMNVGGIVFPHPGEYRFRIYANNEPVMERAVVCRKVGIEGSKHGSED